MTILLLLPKKLREHLPQGVVVPELTVTTESGSTALDVVKAVLKEEYSLCCRRRLFLCEKYWYFGGFLKRLSCQWLAFSINDSFGNNGANDTVVKAGDRLEWHYSLIGYGTDVGNYWDEVPSLTQFSVGGEAEVTLSTKALLMPLIKDNHLLY